MEILERFGWHTGRVHKYQAIAAEIIGNIRRDADRPEGDYAPGKVVSVRGLMAAFDVSDSTAKTVLRNLVADGWVVNVPDVGHFIRDGEPGAPLSAQVAQIRAEQARTTETVADHGEQLAEIRRHLGLDPA